MKTDRFEKYTTINPIEAMRFDAGMEDAWIAADKVGNILSIAGSEEAVRRAATDAAAYSPVVRLPGIDLTPLTFGDWIIAAGGGYSVIAAKDFAERYRPAHGKGLDQGQTDDLIGVDGLVALLDEIDEVLERAPELEPGDPPSSTEHKGATRRKGKTA